MTVSPHSQKSEVDVLKLEEFIPYRLSISANRVSESLSAIYAQRFGIGIPEWRVIATVGQFGVTTAKAVCDHSHMQKAKVSRAVATLKKRRLIERTPNRQDLREAHLKLSPSGLALYEALVPEVRRFEADLLSVLTPTEIAALDTALAKLTAKAVPRAAV